MIERLLRVGLLSIAMAAVWLAHLAATAQQTPPVSKTYILSQATCPPADPKLAAHVPTGATVQVQLPGNRAPNGKWELVAPFPNNLKMVSSKIIDSKARIPGLDAVYIFNFTATAPGKATITMRATPALIIKYPNLKNPDPVMCPRPQNGAEQTYKLDTLSYSLIVD
jgi:Chagasin family peptidase inhibitor I42